MMDAFAAAFAQLDAAEQVVALDRFLVLVTEIDEIYPWIT